MALSENYRTETIGRSDCRPIVRLSADMIVRWDYRPNPSYNDQTPWWTVDIGKEERTGKKWKQSVRRVRWLKKERGERGEKVVGEKRKGT